MMINSKYPFELPELPYAYNALEPVMSEETLHYHHDKHFQTYIDNLNSALKDYPQLQDKTLRELLASPQMLPSDAFTKIMNNGGGVYNHTLFFEGLAPIGENVHTPSRKLKEKINETFGTFDEFKALFTEQALAVFGSGWTYLVENTLGKLQIMNFKNQETPVEVGAKPIILIDVWEHAYYLDYKNLRAQFAENFWKVVKFPDNDKDDTKDKEDD